MWFYNATIEQQQIRPKYGILPPDLNNKWMRALIKLTDIVMWQADPLCHWSGGRIPYLGHKSSQNNIRTRT